MRNQKNVVQPISWQVLRVHESAIGRYLCVQCLCSRLAFPGHRLLPSVVLHSGTARSANAQYHLHRLFMQVTDVKPLTGARGHRVKHIRHRLVGRMRNSAAVFQLHAHRKGPTPPEISNCDQLRSTVTKSCLDVAGIEIGKHCKSLINIAHTLMKSVYEPGGRGFESCRARQINKDL